MVLGCPKEALFAGIPGGGKQLIMTFLAWKPVQGLVNILLHPVIAVTMFSGLIIFWLLPSVHFVAMLDWRLYRLMNWSMALSGLMFWGIGLNSNSIRSPGYRIAMMLAVVPPQILIGLLIFFASHELYPIYTLCGRAFSGVSSITDQQIGGLILWTHGAMMSVIGVLIVIHKELRQPNLILDRTLSAKKPTDKIEAD
jgi:putative membrane protein